MRIVIAPDSFKESASAAAVAEAIAAGWRRVMPGAELVLVPMADGGEGTVDALVAATGGHTRTVRVTGPLDAPVDAVYGVLGDGATAVIEMAAASGLALLAPERRDPRHTTTRGTGELIRDALEQGARRMIVGIGGSATNDGGAGMARALGYRFLDADGHDLPEGGAALAQLDRIDASGKHPGLEACKFLVACDVTNPLCGPNGASRVFGPQKGASEAVAEALDAALARFGAVVERALGVAVCDVPGAGAAGGLGAGLLAFAGARLVPGVDLVADAAGLADAIENASLVITGEGRLDGQTAGGKTPLGVARLAARRGVPVVALAGSLGPGYEALYELGIDAMFSVCPGPMTLAEAVGRTPGLLADAAEALARLWLAAGRGRN